MHWSLVLIKLQVFRPIFKKAYFEEHLETAASACTIFDCFSQRSKHPRFLFAPFSKRLLYISIYFCSAENQKEPILKINFYNNVL